MTNHQNTEFVVRLVGSRHGDRVLYVSSIDVRDGDVETTDNLALARIFSGATWFEHWFGSVDYEMVPAVSK